MANQQNSYDRRTRPLAADDKKMIREIILSDGTAELLVHYAESKAQALSKNGLTTNQLRNIFGEIRKIEALWEKGPDNAQRRLRLMQPKLAYQKARDDKTAEFCNIMTEAIDIVLDRKINMDINIRFRNCINLLEAIVAYHKVYTPDKN